MAYIYKITNKINGKIYIGKTNETINRRFTRHVVDSRRRKFEKRPLYDAMNKYGVDNFAIEEIEQCPYENSSDREIYWIAYYKSNNYKYGYNATFGGDGKILYDYEEIYKCYLCEKSIKKVCNKIGCCRDTVLVAIKNKGVSSEVIRENVNNGMKKPINMIDKDTDEVIREFDGVGDAARFLGNIKCDAHITQVCNGKRKIAYGYKWAYKEC